MQDFRQVHTAQATERRDVFDYSEETIMQLTRRIKPKSLAFDDHIRVHQHSAEVKNDRRVDDENSSQHGKETE